MRKLYFFTLTSLILSACALPTREPAMAYRTEQLAGGWVVAGGALKGREFEAKIDGDDFLMLTVADTTCLPAGSVVFAGNKIGNQMVGMANFCIGNAPISSGKMVVSIEDSSTLSAMIEGYADIHFHEVELERVIRLSKIVDD